MTFDQDLRNYLDRWKAVEAVQADERRAAPIELRWRQLNAAYGIAKGLGLLGPDPSDLGDIETIAANHPNIDKERIRYRVDQFGKALDMPEPWRLIERLIQK